ncbi:D-alanyl-D-alanine carboxypeptidase family protein [Cohnella hashimotonis]|uniref:D-alanyl-D-alanine carboxypeptidase family protein n=1 Tax=Cohnella hashimotonis TaxID=2826895 RepID=A0ABT6TF20_9BACL|nr:D-alanyl-D-alanine carboxypeptidase family protein [Cohnella hashimotonis]MDI4645437.1 D-alanyl-D-alanine carboxypeptidase family protein [Cohnella hashimotonis]
MPASTSIAVQTSPAKPSTHAKAAALIDVASGRLLYSSHGDEPMLIASTTKIMTAIIAIEQRDLNSIVTVSSRAAGKEGSSIYLKAGEKMKLKDMLFGLMLRSGNDAATAIAEHVGGSHDGFVYLMNVKAEEIGMTHSHFANPSGLDQKGHYASANDMAKLAAYALHNPTFREIVGTKVKTAPNPGEEWDYKWVNKNKMLHLYEGADGVKTGYTKQALRTLVSSATREGRQLAAVTLNDGNDWVDHAKLLDYGFAAYRTEQVIAKGAAVEGYPFVAASTLCYPFADGERSAVAIRLELYGPETTDYKLGYRGKLSFRLKDEPIGAVQLLPQPPASD